MEIKFICHGDKEPISEICEGEFLKLIGPNGIGKTTAADFLEIAFGDYNFKDKGFENIKDTFTDCTITITSGEDKLEIILTPGTWKYVDSEFKVEEDSIGTCAFNGNNISPMELRKLIYVKVIRGDEDLEKQIQLVSSMFNILLKKRLNDIEKYIIKLEEYYKHFEEDVKIDLINQYKSFQENYAKDEIEYKKAFENINQLNKNVSTNEMVLDIINSIKIWEDNDPHEIRQQLEKVKSDIIHYEEKSQQNLLRINHLKKALKSIDETKRNKLNSIFEDLKKVQKNKNEILRKIREEFPDQWREIQNAVENKLVGQYQEKKLNRLKELKENFDQIQKRDINLTQILINKFDIILKLLDECQEEGLEDRLILEIIHNDIELKLTIKEFRDYLGERIEFLKSDPEIKKINYQSEEIGKLLLVETKIKEKLDLLYKIQEDENALSSKRSQLTKSITLETYMEPELERNVKEMSILIDEDGQVKNLIDQLIIKRNNLEERLKNTVNLEPLEELKNKLREIIKEMPIDLEQKTQEINEELSKNNELLIIYKKKLDDLSKNILEFKKKIPKIKNEIMERAKNYNREDFSEWINYLQIHLKSIRDVINKLDKFKDDIEFLIKRIDKIEKNEQFQKKERDELLGLISEIYNIYFLKTYDDEAFFKYVFKGYKKIHKFDVIDKNITFLKENNKSDVRRLKEFSSGEKAYAFIRAMIILSKKRSKFNILIVDEAYALMDYMRTGDLTNFQKKLILNKDYNKIINIIPMSKDPEALQEEDQKTYNNLGYYYEIIDI